MAGDPEAGGQLAQTAEGGDLEERFRGMLFPGKKQDFDLGASLTIQKGKRT
jgi:hypothetical protein